MTTKELESRRDKLAAEAQKIIKAAENADRDMTEAEKQRFDTLAQQVQNLDARGKRVRDMEWMSVEPGRKTVPPQPGRFDGPRAGRRLAGSSEEGVVAFRDVRSGETIYGFRGPGGAGGTSVASYLSQSHPAAEAFSEPGALGRWCQYVASPNRDERFLTADERRAMHSFSDIATAPNTAGGYLVPEVLLSGAFIDRLRAKMVLMQAGATVLPLESDSNVIGRLSGGPTFIGSHGENAQESSTTLTFDAVQLVPKTVMCLIRASDEWLMDAVNGAQMIEETLIRETAAKLDEYGLAGTGSQQPTGLVRFSGVNTVTQAPASMDFDDVFDAITECRKDHVEPTGWIISATNANILNKLKINSEANNYAFPPMDIALLPKYVTESIGNDHVVVGDFSQFIWAIRQDVLIKREAQVDRNSQLISVTARVDFALTHPESMCVIAA